MTFSWRREPNLDWLEPVATNPPLPEGYSYGSIGRLLIGTIVQCDACGSTVTDIELHDTWHGKVDQ